MFEVSCPSCNSSFEYDVEDYIHLCPYCSASFIIDLEEGAKDLVGDHYIVGNRIDREGIENIFFSWLKERYHRPDRIKDEFQVLGVYGISLPFWVISMEAHTFWSGHSLKAKQYPGQPLSYGSRFVKEENRFSRRYRWSIMARNSPKEHWGLERLHHPRENIMVDWDGFPLDESMGKVVDNSPPIYDSKQTFKFEHANGHTIAGVQVRERSAIARAKDQVTEYHRRICKTKVGTLYEHRTEIEVVGIQLIHLPFWVLRYAFTPKSVFRYFTTARERRLVISGYTDAVLDAELPLDNTDKVMTNFFICGVLAVVSLLLSFAIHPLFVLVSFLFAAVCVLSAWKIFSRTKVDQDMVKGIENKEPTF